jgi:hypothetical protein
MEASLASLSLQGLSSATSLTSLPPELILDIASHLPLGSLARFSLVSRVVRGVVQPQLYRKVHLWSSEDVELRETKRELVRSVLASLAADPERCKLLRELDVREWVWMEEAELGQLELVLPQASGIKALQLVSWSVTLCHRRADRLLTFLWDVQSVIEGRREAYAPFYSKVWDAVLSLPQLEAMGCCSCPINTPFQLQRLTTMRRFVLVNLIIAPEEDGTLPPLMELTLERVAEFDSIWFPPSLLASLRKLDTRSLPNETTQAIASVLQVSPSLLLISLPLTDWDPTQARKGNSTLKTRLVDLHSHDPRAAFDAMV